MKKLKDLKKEIESLQGTIEIKATDLRKEKEIFKLFDAIRGIWEGVRILINNAGIGYKVGLLEENALKWREMLETNVLAPTLCAQQAIADMRRLGIEGMINLCSMADTESLPKVVCILRQKFAVNSLTEGIRQELRALKVKLELANKPRLCQYTFFAPIFR